MNESAGNKLRGSISCTVCAGHKVASGQAENDRRFPSGTIEMQVPHFREKGFDLKAYFNGDYVSGTLNLSIKPHTYHIGKPDYFLEAVKWTPLFPPENFFLGGAEIIYKDVNYRALIYIPDPSTKPDHFQPPDIIEVIAQKIPGISYGEKVMLLYNPQFIKVIRGEESADF